jgi:hypothetical protein
VRVQPTLRLNGNELEAEASAVLCGSVVSGSPSVRSGKPPSTNLFERRLCALQRKSKQNAHIGQIGVAVSPLYAGGKTRFGEIILNVLS